MKIYSKEAQAQKVLNEQDNESLGFCPVINQECRKDCVCYSGGFVRGNDKNGWCVEIDPQCLNPMIIK